MTDTAAAPPLPKVDPETLVLRNSPIRAMRFRRGLIVALIAGVALLLVVVAWRALRPRLFHAVAEDDRQDQPAKPSSEAFERAPASYGDVLKLGPPLPGDLGWPILERQRALDRESSYVAGGGADATLAQAAQAEREQRLADLKAARQSGVIVQTGSRTEPVANATAEPQPAAAPDSRSAIDLTQDPNAQGRKAEFVATLDKSGDINPHMLTRPASTYLLSAGSVIAASLITGLHSDLRGLVTAQVTQSVYDSASGQHLLIPQGSRLIGSYDSVVAFGQRRALVVWQRIILPDASSLRLDNVPATDSAGYAGLQDRVDFHTWSLLKGVVLSTILGVGSELALAGEGDLIQAIRLSTQDNVSRAGDQLTQRNLQVQPTITIRPGATVRLVVHRDLILGPWTGERP